MSVLITAQNFHVMFANQTHRIIRGLVAKFDDILAVRDLLDLTEG